MHKRPTNVAGVKEALSRFMTAEGLEKALAFQPEPTDVFVSPFAKCGTTWMQQIVHGLRTGGDMNFNEISEVVPWLEMGHDIQLDVTAQMARPRAFKSHLGWDRIPKGGRYIVVLRDPIDAMVSMHAFFEGWFFEPGTIGIEDFANYFLERDEGRNYWDHAASWWAVRERADVLLFSFETMKTDLPTVVNRVADFIGVEEAQAREVATRQASFDFMKAREDQFNDHLTSQARDAVCGLPPGGTTSKVVKGTAGAGKPQVSQAVRDAFDKRWQVTLGAQFGLADYAALRDILDHPLRA